MMLNAEGMKQLKEIENKFKSGTFYDAETKKDIEFLLIGYNSLTWDVESLKEKLNEFLEQLTKLQKEKEDTEQLKTQLQAKNTFLIEKHLTSKYAKWLVEYNKQKRAT